MNPSEVGWRRMPRWRPVDIGGVTWAQCAERGGVYLTLFHPCSATETHTGAAACLPAEGSPGAWVPLSLAHPSSILPVVLSGPGATLQPPSHPPVSKRDGGSSQGGCRPSGDAAARSFSIHGLSQSPVSFRFGEDL